MPDAAQQAQQLGQQGGGFLQDAQETSLNTGYVGGNTRIGIGVDSKMKGKVEASQVFGDTGSSATIGQGYVGFDPKAKDKGQETVTGAGAKVSHHWVSGDPLNPSHVNKVFGAYDQNAQKDKKVTVGYGQERADLFWSGHASKGISDGRTVGNGLVEKAYDYGVGGRVGTYVDGAAMRVQGGVDYEWGKDFAASEKRPTQTTLTGGVEKFFPDTPHSIGAEVEVYKKSGGALLGDNKAETRGGISYRYDIASEAGVWQPEQRFRRIRTEIPGEEIKQPPKVERKLVKHTMELEADTFFELDSAKLTKEAKERLHAIMAQIRKTGYEGAIRITGNTCDLGSDAYNQKLSERRANAVREFMAQNGFNAEELQARGLGESEPKYPNTDKERHKNRRVDLEYVSYQNEYKDQVVEQGGTTRTDPKVVWRQELIPEPPLWVRQALRNVADHKQTVDTYTTAAGSIPVAVDDSVETSPATPVSIKVLANDKDPNSDPLTIKAFGQGANGSVTLAGNELIYTPKAGFTGTDSFTYTIADPAGNTATATVTVVVKAGTPTNQLSVRNDTVDITTGTATAIPVLDNDQAGQGELKITAFDSKTPKGGTISQSRNDLVYTPAPGFVGEDTFTYTVTDDSGKTAKATVTVRVKPVAGNVDAKDDTYTIQKNSQATPLNITGNDELPAGETITVSIDKEPAHGTATVNGIYVNYTPNRDYTGFDTITYRITTSGGRGWDIATIELNVGGCVECVPLTLKNDYWLIDINNTTTQEMPVLKNDQGEGMTIVSVTQPRYGHAAISPDGKFIRYTLRHGYCEDHEFTYVVRDKYGNEKTATVIIDVKPEDPSLKP